MRIQALSVPLMAMVLAVYATGASADEIAQRKAAMDDINDAAKVLFAMVKNERPFDGKDAARSGYTVLNNLTAAAMLFPEGSVGENSRARPEIWQEMEHFAEDFEKAKMAAQEIADSGGANDEGAFRKNVIQLGEACKACHEHFRKPRKET